MSNENNHGTNFKLVEGDEILNDDEKIADELRKLFQNALSNIKILENSFIQSKDYHNL